MKRFKAKLRKYLESQYKIVDYDFDIFLDDDGIIIHTKKYLFGKIHLSWKEIQFINYLIII